MKTKAFESVKKILKAVLFVALFLSLYTYTRDVLRDKSESEALGVIMQQKNENYDVILAGSSHIQYSVQPKILKEKYSVNACNTATAAQSVPTSYFVIKEMIDRHQPKAVVLDLFCMFYPENYFTDTRFHQAIDNFPIGKTKIEAVNALSGDNKSEFYLNYMLYHGRWKTLTKYDYTIHDEFDETMQVLDATESFENDFVPLDENIKGEIPQIAQEYLEKIIKLCKETDTELILTVIPYRADTFNNSVTGEYQQSVYNSVSDLAKEWNVDYINLLHKTDELGFDFQTDMAEFSHVNRSGSEKVSDYFGKILKNKLS